MSGHHMDPEEFRAHGHALVDWIAGYLERVEDLPVRSRVAPGAVADRLPASPPEQGEPFADMLRDVDDIVVPGLTHWQSPSFFGYFPANSSGPSVLGELLSAGLGVQGMLWSTSPAATELEMRVLDWLRQLLDLPDRFGWDGAGGAVIADSASSANLCALLAARHRAGGADPSLVVYASEHTHSSVEKAVRIAGLAADQLRLVPADAEHAMRPDQLDRLVREDQAAGRRPCMVAATVGTTSSMAVDPVPVIGQLCSRTGIWLHVDAAMAGAAAVCPELRWIHEGLQRADSYCVDAHKWLFTNFDCTAFFVADRDALTGALSVQPEYLRNAASDAGEVVDYRDWQIPLGRRFRALKLWFVLRHYGAAGLRHHIREHVALAGELADRIRRDDRFELVSSVLNLVCFRHRAGDATSAAILEQLNASGAIFLTHTRLDGRYVLRLSVGQTRTERRHVELAWRLLSAAADAMVADNRER
ncbi:MAG TPA: pyridoxal-dependent decarboxylase [Egibacteraceae bacterium]|nr:pyridoxal-dependent decarboxylase [Egibacteraceae bacterium]